MRTVLKCLAFLSVILLLGLSGFKTGLDPDSFKAHAASSPPGPVWATGYNVGGALGDGTTIDSSIPVAVHLSEAIAVAAGFQSSAALMPDGTVWTWGNVKQSISLAQINPKDSSLTNVVAIASGYSHFLALKADGTVWAWGVNVGGQTGDPNYGRYAFTGSPYKVNISGVVAIAGGAHHSLALKSDGTVWAWGANSYGQLGGGSTGTIYTSPIQATNLSGVVGIAAGDNHSLAVKDDGTVWAWGSNSQGQLGNGESGYVVISATPQPVAGITTAIQAAGGANHSIVLLAEGNVLAWGDNGWGQLGDLTFIDSTVPVQVIELDNVVKIDTNSIYNLAIKTDGTAWGWGSNWYGQLGNGLSGEDSALAVQCLVPDDVIDVAAGFAHSLFLLKSSPVYDPLVVTTNLLPHGTSDTDYSVSLAATGGLAPYVWQVSAENLPTGLNLDGVSGIINGSAIAAGSYTFSIDVVDAVGTVATKEFSLDIYEPLVVTTNSFPFGYVGTNYLLDLSAAGGLAPYLWEIYMGRLPAGLTLVGAAGSISGIPNAAGSNTFSIAVMDAIGAVVVKDFSMEIYNPLVVTTTSMGTSIIGVNYSQFLTASGGLPPYSWSIDSGILPDGLTLNSVTGEIYGIATTAGTLMIKVSVADVIGSLATMDVNISADYPDVDSDRYKSNIDCNDEIPSINPGALEVCKDGIDNDCNPTTDDNTGCVKSAEICNDGADNDGDGTWDCGDNDCKQDPYCATPPVEVCDDGIDNDGDSTWDCGDDDCKQDPYCATPTVEVCDDGTDNDGDGTWDCGDDDCKKNPYCAVPPVEICNDVLDNDGDNLTDCADDDCKQDPYCAQPIEVCDDGIDNDGDNLADCADNDCKQEAYCPK